MAEPQTYDLLREWSSDDEMDTSEEMSGKPIPPEEENDDGFEEVDLT